MSTVVWRSMPTTSTGVAPMRTVRFLQNSGLTWRLLPASPLNINRRSSPAPADMTTEEIINDLHQQQKQTMNLYLFRDHRKWWCLVIAKDAKQAIETYDRLAARYHWPDM